MACELCYLHKAYWKMFQALEMRLILYGLTTSQYIQRLYKSVLNALSSSIGFTVCYKETSWTAMSNFPFSTEPPEQQETHTSVSHF